MKNRNKPPEGGQPSANGDHHSPEQLETELITIFSDAYPAPPPPPTDTSKVRINNILIRLGGSSKG